MIVILNLLFWIVLPAVCLARGESIFLESGSFQLEASDKGIVGLRRINDVHDTGYIAPDHALGADVTVRFRRTEVAGSDWIEKTGGTRNEDCGDSRIVYASTDSNDLRMEQEFRVKEDSLDWTITLVNLGDGGLEVGDLAVPLVFAEKTPRDRGNIYTQKLIRHSYISGHGSWVYWSRANAVGPYLVMTPSSGTGFEYFDSTAQAFTPYVHAAAAGRGAIQKARDLGGNAPPWRLPLSSKILSAKGTDDATVTYRFRFRFAANEDAVRDVLYDEGLFDTQVLPGMALPVDLPALISLRTKAEVRDIEAEYPESTQIEYLGERERDQHIYRIHFSRLGENLLKVRYGAGEWMSLEFFVMEPLETVIGKRASFLVGKQQHDDPGKPWYGAYGDWDQMKRVLRNPEDRDGLRPWLVDSSDDAGNARPAFIAAKNVFFPVQSEIDSVERYIRFYLWNDLKDGKGGMQMTENEKYPFGIYGTFDNWWGHRASEDPGRDGRAHLWRIYDYPHIIHLYYRMYQLASYYPEMVKWRSADQYLELAYRTAKAYWEVPLKIEGWSADSVGTMNEAFIPELIDALTAAGKQSWADEIRGHWEGKVAEFVLRTPNLYGSEFSFDSTGFESTHAFARYALEHAGKGGALKNSKGKPGFGTVSSESAMEFYRFQAALNVVDRGWLETSYYQLGSDYRGNLTYLLSYMTQLGGWSLVDDALYFSDTPADYLRLGYASSLAGWAVVNSGTSESGYGYWYPGKENDGAAGGGFMPQAWGRAWIGKDVPRGAWYYSAEQDVGFVGALRTHCTVLTDDPVFGEVVFGGLFEREGNGVKVVPRDGLRVRFHVLKGGHRLHLTLERDGFAKEEPIFVSDALDQIRFSVENRGGPEHPSRLRIEGMPEGSYSVSAGGQELGIVEGRAEPQWISLPIKKDSRTGVRITKIAHP